MADQSMKLISSEKLIVNKSKYHPLEEETKSLNTFVFVDATTGYNAILKTAIAEGIAYFFLVLCIFFNGGDQTKFIFGFWAIFMVFGNVSGAHVNPIVSVALWIYNGNLFVAKNMIKMFLFILFQLVGGIIAAVLSYCVYRKKVAHFSPGDDDSVSDIIVVESFFSGTLAFVALFITCTATRPSNKNYVNLSLIAVWLYLIINAGADISGGSYNPTLYIVLNGVAYFSNTDEKAFKYIFVYVLFPFLGSILFSLLFKFVFKPYYLSKNRKVITAEED